MLRHHRFRQSPAHGVSRQPLHNYRQPHAPRSFDRNGLFGDVAYALPHDQPDPRA